MLENYLFLVFGYKSKLEPDEFKSNLAIQGKVLFDPTALRNAIEKANNGDDYPFGAKE